MSRLSLVPATERDVAAIHDYLAERTTRGAAAWYQAFLSCSQRVAERPLAYGLAPEHARLRRDVRQALFRTRRGRTYRFLFVVVGDEVRILRVRGPGQAPLQSTELPEP